MADVTTSDNGKGLVLVWKAGKETACLNMLFWNSVALIEMFSNVETVESFTGLKTLVHIQAFTYGIKLSLDIVQFNRGSNWHSLLTKHSFCQYEGLNWQKSFCVTPVPKVSLHASPNTAGPPIVIRNNFICCMCLRNIGKKKMDETVVVNDCQ